MPVPLRPIDNTLLPVTEIAAEKALAARGVNVTLIVQEPLAASVAGLIGQLLVCAKSPGLVPLTAIPLIVAALAPVLVRVIACAALVVFAVWLAKLMEAGNALTEVFVLSNWNDSAHEPEMPTVVKHVLEAET